LEQLRAYLEELFSGDEVVVFLALLDGLHAAGRVADLAFEETAVLFKDGLA